MATTDTLTPLPPMPTRTVSTNLTDADLDRLDHIRRMSPNLPSRAALIREAVQLWLDLHEDPATAVGQLIDGLAVIYGAEETPDDPKNPNGTIHGAA